MPEASTDIIAYVKLLSEHRPDIIVKTIRNGDSISRIVATTTTERPIPAYRMDVPKTLRLFGERKSELLPYDAIDQAFVNDTFDDNYVQKEVLRFFEIYGKVKGDRRIAPFSKALMFKFGCCFEKSLLTHILADRKGLECFLVYGWMDVSPDIDENGGGSHSFNIARFPDGKAHLIDVHTSFYSGREKVYSTPIEKIESSEEFYRRNRRGERITSGHRVTISPQVCPHRTYLF